MEGPAYPKSPKDKTGLQLMFKMIGFFLLILGPMGTQGEGPHTVAELYTTKGDIFYSQKQPDSAFVYYDKAIAIDPEATTAMNNAAYYLANSDKDLDRALELVERCMALRPNDPTTMDTYAWVLFKLKRYDEALKAIDQVLEEGNEDILSSEVYDHAGDIYFMNQQPKEALEYWKKALELDGDNELLKRKVQHKTYFYE